MTSNLVATISDKYANTKWYSVEEIEYVLQQPIEESFKIGLPIYYKQSGWQEVYQADILMGKLYLHGSFKISTLTCSIINHTDSHTGLINGRRKLDVTCSLLADGYTQFRLTPEILDNLFEDMDNIQALNTLNPLLEFSQTTYSSEFNSLLNPPLNYLHSNPNHCSLIACPEQALKEYCEQYFINNYAERLENIETSKLVNSGQQGFVTAENTIQTTNISPNEPPKKSTPSKEDSLATQGRKPLTRTARALAKVIVPELSDVPTSSQLDELLRAMEYEHNDYNLTKKTLQKHLTNPD